MTLEENKRVVRRHFEEIFNEQNLDVIEEITALDYREHGVAPFQSPTSGTKETPDGPESLRATAKWLLVAFPDLRFTIERMIAEDDMVAVRLVMEGTHQGAFQGIAPTGKRIQGTRTDLFRVQEGKISEHWANRDDLGMFLQLGVFQAPGQSRS
jgi:predicted ester cyclase